MQSQPTALLLEALSERLLRERQLALWRELFLSEKEGSLSFRHEHVFLMATDAPMVGWRASELALFATRFRGWHDAAAGSTGLIAFASPEHALRAALLLQKIGGENNVRATLGAGACVIASFGSAERMQHLLLPSGDVDPSAALRRVSPSTVLVDAAAYPAVEPLLADETRDVLVTTEYDEDQLPEALVTLLPVATSFSSTFAGLGSC